MDGSGEPLVLDSLQVISPEELSQSSIRTAKRSMGRIGEDTREKLGTSCSQGFTKSTDVELKVEACKYDFESF